MQVLQPAPLQPVQQDAEGRLLPVQPGATMDRQKWQLMAQASGWTQGELLLLLLRMQACKSQQVALPVPVFMFSGAELAQLVAYGTLLLCVHLCCTSCGRWCSMHIEYVHQACCVQDAQTSYPHASHSMCAAGASQALCSFPLLFAWTHAPLRYCLFCCLVFAPAELATQRMLHDAFTTIFVF